MKFEQLLQNIQTVDDLFFESAYRAINRLTLFRNWTVGYYLVEYEQQGEDRAAYGERLLEKISESLKNKGIRGFSLRNLRNFRSVYQAYPQIRQLISAEFTLPDWGNEIRQLPIAELKRTEKLLQHCGYTHLLQLTLVEDPVKRSWYEDQACKGHWTVEDLKRQIHSLVYDRGGKDNKITLPVGGKWVESPFRDPCVFEFSRMGELSGISESDLEKALLDHLQSFMLELGHGFCFEARQQRISIDGEHDRIDLVFYNRILKCHVLVELKVREFQHGDAGQMNFYLNYYKNEVMQPGDNPPIGLLLCTHKNHTKVEYATAGLDSQMFVSKYQLVLPKLEDLERLIDADRLRIESELNEAHP